MNPFLDIVLRVQAILNALVPIFITLALIYFIYGVIQYVVGKEEGAKEQGRNIMIYGAIGLFVIVSVWGIVNILQQFTGTQTGVTPTVTLPK